jgi:hypothetical protein
MPMFSPLPIRISTAILRIPTDIYSGFSLVYPGNSQDKNSKEYKETLDTTKRAAYPMGHENSRSI